MPRVVSAFVSSVSASAQTGDGSLRGYVRDPQGTILPGVTVTATSPDLPTPLSVVSDAAGCYRLNNLRPGTYPVTAELTGFASYKREGILMRAGSTFTVDIEMTLSTVQESVTVTGESPILLPRRGDFFACVPARRRAGRIVCRLLGPLDWIRRRHRRRFRAEARRRRRGGANGTGVVMNIITPSGGNRSGTAARIGCSARRISPSSTDPPRAYHLSFSVRFCSHV